MMTLIEFHDHDILTNLVTILSLKPDKVVFIFDQHTNSKEIDFIYMTCHQYLKNLKYEMYPVNSDDLTKLSELTKSIMVKNKNAYVDLTDGNSLMTISGFEEGIENNTILVYADLKNNVIVNVKSNEKLCDIARISLEDFLKAKGACTIDNTHSTPKSESFPTILKMCKYVFAHLKEWK